MTTSPDTHKRATREEVSMRAGRRTVRLTNPGKLLFPDDGLTKADLAAYYRDVAPAMVPLVRGRPLSLHRFNDGIAGKGFFQQEIPGGAPNWVKRVDVAKHGGSVCHVLADDAATLVWLANQNCITPHVWSSRADRLDRPDRMIFDLDPARSDDDWPLVTRTARELIALLEELGATPFAMTSGSRGVHVVVPLRRRYGFDSVQKAADAVAGELVSRRPDDLTTEFRKAKRADRLFVDVLRTRYGQLAVAPYAVRARPGAPVATPLRNDELDEGALASARAFTLRDVPGRLARDGDPWAGIVRAAGRLPAP
jgi:bifunctional non-homologous end joining protein LigD